MVIEGGVDSFVRLVYSEDVEELTRRAPFRVKVGDFVHMIRRSKLIIFPVVL